MSDNNIHEYEVDLREYIALIWNRKWLILSLVIVAIFVAWITSSFLIDKTYNTEATLKMTDVSGSYSSVNQLREVLRGEAIAGPILSNFGYEQDSSKYRDFIRNNINLIRVDNINFFRLKVSASEPETAYQIAQSLIDAFLEGSDEQYERWMSRRENELENYRQRRENYDRKIQEAEQQMHELAESDIEAVARNLIDSSISQRISLYIQEYDRQQERIFSLEDKLADIERAEIINEAYMPTSPSEPRVKLNMAVAAVLAGMIGVFGIFFIEFLKEDDQ